MWMWIRWEFYAFKGNTMKSIENIRLTEDSTIKEALEVIDKAAMQIAVVTDSDNKLIGTITDGDLRRGF